MRPTIWRTDMLTMRDAQGVVHPTIYLGVDAEERARIRRALVARGYSVNLLEITHVKQPHVPGDRSWDASPEQTAGGCAELRADGLWPVITLGTEQAARWPSVSDYRRVMGTHLPPVRELIAGCLVGVEADEGWDWDEIADIAVAAWDLTELPVAIHFRTDVWGPNSEEEENEDSELNWWLDLVRRRMDAQWRLAFQFPKRADTLPEGFLATADDVRRLTGSLVSKLAPLGVGVIAGEYAHERPEAKAVALGAAALGAGAIGFLNGGPGA